eukprot:4491889-Amphidinium_carterae.1
MKDMRSSADSKHLGKDFLVKMVNRQCGLLVRKLMSWLACCVEKRPSQVDLMDAQTFSAHLHDRPLRMVMGLSARESEEEG